MSVPEKKRCCLIDTWNLLELRHRLRPPSLWHFLQWSWVVTYQVCFFNCESITNFCPFVCVK
jgi:hypothetical protein